MKRAGLAALIVLVATATTGYFALRSRVTPASLASSVASAAGGVPWREQCARQQPGWTCVVFDVTHPSDAPIVTYRVNVEGRCWRATSITRSRWMTLPKSTRGCIGFGDQF